MVCNGVFCFLTITKQSLYVRHGSQNLISSHTQPSDMRTCATKCALKHLSCPLSCPLSAPLSCLLSVTINSQSKNIGFYNVFGPPRGVWRLVSHDFGGSWAAQRRTYGRTLGCICASDAVHDEPFQTNMKHRCRTSQNWPERFNPASGRKELCDPQPPQQVHLAANHA